jgi:hypothetical protein
MSTTPTTIKLGDLCRDTVTQFEGVAIARTEYISGCARVSLQPAVGKDGKLAEQGHFDEPMLKVVKAQQVASLPSNRGGPRPAPSQRSAVPR